MEERIHNSLSKFLNLNEEEKNLITHFIMANMSILSPKIKERFINLIENNLCSIIVPKEDDIYSEFFLKNKKEYRGYISTKTERTNNKNVYKALYDITICLASNLNSEFDYTRSFFTGIHEFSHLAALLPLFDTNNKENTEKNSFKPTTTGAKIVNFSFDENNFSYGEALEEIANEFLIIQIIKNYFGIEDFKDLSKFEKTIKNYISKEENKRSDEPVNLFNKFEEYDAKYTPYYGFSPLFRVILHSFNNPKVNELALNNYILKHKGFDAKINKQPVNDFLYGYYNNSLYIENCFNKFAPTYANWKQVCNEFDKRMFTEKIDETFVTDIIRVFCDFYGEKIYHHYNENIIDMKTAEKRLEEFDTTVKNVLNTYDNDQKTKSKKNRH